MNFSRESDHFANLGQVFREMGKQKNLHSGFQVHGVVWLGESMAVGKRVHLQPWRPQLCHPLLLGVIYKNKKKRYSQLLGGYGAQLAEKGEGVTSCQLRTFRLSGMHLPASP